MRYAVYVWEAGQWKLAAKCREAITAEIMAGALEARGYSVRLEREGQ